MNEEQLRLMATILNEVVDKYVPAFAPYHSFGANAGQCTSCGAIGQVKYPNVVYAHTDTCLITLNEKLQASLKESEGMND